MLPARACSAVVLLVALADCFAAGEPERPVFAGAVGFGVSMQAGRGGAVLRVTNLDPDGPGSLRAAMEANGPRIVVFEVGGVIDLRRKGIRLKEPFLTVAGQTAPSPGVTIIGGGLAIKTHDILIQHIRIRPGDANQPKKSGWEPDGISTDGGECYNIVIDHCSLTWAVDENLSASGPRFEGPQATTRRTTFSNCIIAEGLRNASHAKGAHSMGSLIHDCCQEIAVIGNLYAHNNARNPYFKAHCTGAIVNNVIYNPGGSAIQLDFIDSEWREANFRPVNAKVSVVGNVLYHGRDTKRGLALVARKGDAYMEDNLAFDKDGNAAPLTSGAVTELKEKPAWPAGLKALPAKEVVEHVVRHAGARPKDRDEIDKRIIREFQERKGRIIDSQDEVGGYPRHKMTQRTLDVPADVRGWLAKLAAEVE